MKTFLAFLALACPAAAGMFDPDGKAIDDFVIELEGRWWLAELRGEIEADSDFVGGTSIDLPDQLDIERASDGFLEGAAMLRLRRLQIRGAYFEGGFEEGTRLEETIVFDGTTFTLGTEIETELDFRVASLDFHVLLVDAGDAKELGFELGVGVGARYLAFDAHIEEEFSGLNEDEDGDGFLPVVSLYASLGFANIFRVEAHAGGVVVPHSFPRVGGAFIDGSLAARVYFHHAVYGTLGYRIVHFDAEYDFGSVEAELDLTLSGFFAGVGVSF
jgi:hypothetical protein